MVHVAATEFQYLPLVGSWICTSTCRTLLASAAVPPSRSGASAGGDVMEIVGFTVSGDGRALHPNRCTRPPSWSTTYRLPAVSWSIPDGVIICPG